MKTKITWDEFVKELKDEGLAHVIGGLDKETRTFINVLVKPSNLQKWITVLKINPLSQMRHVVNHLVNQYEGKQISDGTEREIQFKKGDFPKI